MDILKNVVLPIVAIDLMARNILGDTISGVSVSSNTRVHLIDDSQANQGKAQAILDNFDELLISADKTAMTEGDSDPVVSCHDALIADDSDVNYIVLLDGDDYASGMDTVVAGVVDLTLASPVAGVYEVFIYRTTGNYASGSVTITVN